MFFPFFHDFLDFYRFSGGFGNLNGRTLLDVGCGHGDFFRFVSELYPDLDYFGLDQEKAFLEVAVERYGTKPNTKFFFGEIFNMTNAS